MTQEKQINVPWEKTIPVKCENCEHEIFENAVLIRSLSKFVTNEPDDMEIPVQVPVCRNCGIVPSKYMQQFSNVKTQ